jgi:hypothetical protein
MVFASLLGLLGQKPAAGAVLDHLAGGYMELSAE